MNDKKLYQFMIAIVIIAIVKLLLDDDYGNAIVLIVALVPLIQDLRSENAEDTQS